MFPTEIKLKLISGTCLTSFRTNFHPMLVSSSTSPMPTISHFVSFPILTQPKLPLVLDEKKPLCAVIWNDVAVSITQVESWHVRFTHASSQTMIVSPSNATAAMSLSSFYSSHFSLNCSLLNFMHSLLMCHGLSQQKHFISFRDFDFPLDLSRL